MEVEPPAAFVLQLLQMAADRGPRAFAKLLQQLRPGEAALSEGTVPRRKLELDITSYVALIQQLLESPKLSVPTVRLALNLALEKGATPLPLMPPDATEADIQQVQGIAFVSYRRINACFYMAGIRRKHCRSR